MKISVLIPCHNEEKSIRKCVQSCLHQTRLPDEIVVVNDGSTDKSQQILKSFGTKIKVVNFYPTLGSKSHAQENGLKYITGDVLVTTDGDTVIDPGFVQRIEAHFKDKRVVAVAGYVKSLKYNWLTACRAYEYAIGQNIHKLAQSIVGFMFVIPGCAGAFRTEIVRKYLTFDHDSVTEDLDFTYKLHKNGFKIVFDRLAVVYTQDPTNLHSYINQMRRWLGGGWQNLIKHLDNNLISHPGRALELSLIYIEGTIFSVLIFLIPLINIRVALRFFLLFFLIIFAQSIYAATKEKRIDLIRISLYYPFLSYLNSAIFLEQFVKVFVLRKNNLVWFHPKRVKI